MRALEAILYFAPIFAIFAALNIRWLHGFRSCWSQTFLQCTFNTCALAILGKLFALLFKAVSIQGCLIHAAILDSVTMFIFRLGAGAGMCRRSRVGWGNVVRSFSNEDRGRHGGKGGGVNWRKALNRVFPNRGQMWSAFLWYMYVCKFFYKICRHLQEKHYLVLCMTPVSFSHTANIQTSKWKILHGMYFFLYFCNSDIFAVFSFYF